MAETCPRPVSPVPPAPAPQDLDDMIFRWESDVPTVSDR